VAFSGECPLPVKALSEHFESWLPIYVAGELSPAADHRRRHRPLRYCHSQKFRRKWQTKMPPEPPPMAPPGLEEFRHADGCPRD
jgi:hypothetical protein